MRSEDVAALLADRFWLSLNLPSMRAMGMRKPMMPASMVRRKPSGIACQRSMNAGSFAAIRSARRASLPGSSSTSESVP